MKTQIRKRAPSVASAKHAGGRPPKFKEPSRPVTVTLPERTLERLAAIDADRAKAIVKATGMMAPQEEQAKDLVQVVEVMPGTGIILVGSSRRLKQIPWLRVVEVSPHRNLLVLPKDMSADSLEVALQDLMESIPANETREHRLIAELHRCMRMFRRDHTVTKAEILFVNTRR